MRPTPRRLEENKRQDVIPEERGRTGTHKPMAVGGRRPGKRLAAEAPPTPWAEGGHRPLKKRLAVLPGPYRPGGVPSP